MKIGIPLEVTEGERRVAATPDTVKKLKKLGFEVMVSRDAGAEATYSDAAYADAGAEIVSDDVAWSTADILLKVTPPTVDEAAALGVPSEALDALRSEGGAKWLDSSAQTF